MKVTITVQRLYCDYINKVIRTSAGSIWSQIMEPSCMNDDVGLELVLSDMIQKCKMEADAGKLKIPLKDYIGRVSYYTGVAENKLKAIHTKMQSNDISRYCSTLKDIDLQIEILALMSKLYSQGITPTYEVVYENLNKYNLCTDFDQFKQKATLMGLQHNIINLPTTSHTILEQSVHYAYEQYYYLDKITQLRTSNTNIYYVDERLIDKELNAKKIWTDNMTTACESQEYVLFYAISNAGYKTGLFSNCVNVETFNKWMIDVLLESIEPSSVIVLNDSPLHAKLKTDKMCFYNTKQDMMKWLQQNNVPHSSSMNKGQLYILIEENTASKEQFYIDEIFKAHGHKVLRLPTHLHNLSPVNRVWEEINSSGRLLQPSFESKDEIHAQLVSMPEEKFLQFEKEIAYRENILFSQHIKLGDAQSNFVSGLTS